MSIDLYFSLVISWHVKMDGQLGTSGVTSLPTVTPTLRYPSNFIHQNAPQK